MNPVIGTWGNYQDVPEGEWNLSVHFHEGLDIASKNRDAGGEDVLAVTAGKVLEIQRDRINPYVSFIVTQEKDNPTIKWTYKHIEASADLVVGKNVQAGQVVGKVVKAKDLPAHVHLDRGTGTDLESPIGESRNKQQPVPKLNPLKAFDPALDTVAPTIEEVRFRPAKEDRLGDHQQTNAQIKLQKEKPRDPAPAFTSTGIVRGQPVTLVGKLPDPWVDNNIAGVSDPGVDIVSNMYDRFGTAANASLPKVNIALAAFDITGQTFARTTGQIASFNFSAINDPELTSYRYFANFERTRSINANDKTSDSMSFGPYFYTITNTGNRDGTFGTGGRFPPGSPRGLLLDQQRKGG